MKPSFVISDTEVAARRAATVPRDNVWVSANAGAGKTTLLRDRVIRMLLEGVAPDRILCLTYTKAAAAEMQDRIFGELARWVGLQEAELAKVIQDLTGGVKPAHLRRARALFAEAVETPGGLKIQTIHAFAERLLHLFPIEAGVPVDFSVPDEAEAASLREEARRATLVRAAANSTTRLGRAFSTILQSTKIGTFASITREAMGVLGRLEARGGLLAEEALDTAIEEQFGISPDVSETALEDQFLASLPPPAEALAIGEAILALEPGPDTVQTAAKLVAYGRAEGRAAIFEAAYAINIDSKGTYAVGRTIDKPTLKMMPHLASLPSQLKENLNTFLAHRAQLRSARCSQALNVFAKAMLTEFSRLKAERRMLDFEDMIILLRRMLGGGQAAWVMMKLDAAIEHVLVDEAQDTTPEMWDIVREITGDFFSGEGQVSRPRSLFVVGDEKQSIYSFQGAEPRIFDAMRQDFARAIGPESLVANPVRLRSSFRSSPDVLDAIDQVFQHEDRRAGLSADGEKPGHSAAQPELPGLMECWPLEEHLPEPAGTNAAAGSSHTASPAMRMAQRIAGTIQDWLDNGEVSAGKPIGPGDILILVQKRGPFFNALLRALGERKIPVAGADRLKIQHEIGVQDLIAIASAALLPRDDLMLATALKSPIFGLDDNALEPLCRQRGASLRDEITTAAKLDARLAAIEARLRLLEEQALRLSPFDFLCTLLGEDCPGRVGVSGRAAMLKRLGADAAEAIDAFLGDALEFGQRHLPSLALFIAAEAGQQREIKRDLDSGQGRVRVMTVHAAKGLEARVVFVADAMSTKHSSTDPKVHSATYPAGGMLLWSGRSADAAEPIREAGRQAKARAFEEYRRLLYVGLTRARERLYVVGHRVGKLGKESLPSDLPKKPVREWPWHALVTQAMRESARVIEVPSNEENRLPTLRWPPSRVAKTTVTDDKPSEEAPRLSLLLHPLTMQDESRVIRPSQATVFQRGEQNASNGARSRSRRRGVLVHKLFQLLPQYREPERWRVAHNLIRNAFPGLPDHEIEAIFTPVLAALAGPELAGFFAEGSRAEVGMAGPVRLENGLIRHVSGQLDRIRVSANCVDILDFKTGIRPNSGPSPEIFGQMAMYRALARDVFGKSDVVCHLYWTAIQTLETLSDTTLDAAFSKITSA
ncbi:MAG: double-strand break repair helicase AddA [Rhabdaerophilum sp.]